MENNKLTADDLALYAAANKADDAFQAAVIKQFGKNNAGTMRYMGSKHNAETKAASSAYWIAANAWLDAMKKAA